MSTAHINSRIKKLFSGRFSGHIFVAIITLTIVAGFYFFQTLSQNHYSIFQNYLTEIDGHNELDHDEHDDEHGAHAAVTQDFLIRVNGKSTFKADERPILKLAEEFDLARNVAKRSAVSQNENGRAG